MGFVCRDHVANKIFDYVAKSNDGSVIVKLRYDPSQRCDVCGLKADFVVMYEAVVPIAVPPIFEEKEMRED